MTPTTLTVEPKDIEEGDILVSDLGQRVALPILYADGFWFVYSSRDRLIRMLAMDATVEVIRNVDDEIVAEEAWCGGHEREMVDAEAMRLEADIDDCPPRGIVRSRGLYVVTP